MYAVKVGVIAQRQIERKQAVYTKDQIKKWATFNWSGTKRKPVNENTDFYFTLNMRLMSS